MNERPIYDRKPLREAIFELFVDPNTETSWTDASIERINSVLPEFAFFEERMMDIGLQITMRDGLLTPMTYPQRTRVRRWDVDKGKAVQFGVHMCALNVLGSAYTRYEDQQATIRVVLDFFTDEAKPSAIAWIGQRYINAIKIPVGDVDLESYFPFYPKLPAPARHRPLAIQVETHVTEDARVVANLSLQEVTDTEATYSLDVYARSEGPVANDVGSIAAWHDSIHKPVHDTFEMFISNRCREIFGEVK